MKKDNIATFFEPKGVVLVGARRSHGFGYGIPQQMIEQGWGDRIHLVNPKGGEIDGLPVYTTIANVPDPVDLAIVIIPAVHVPKALEEIAQRGIRHVIIESAGFIETDSEGAALQDEIKQIQEKHHLRVIGPNCIGLSNNDNRFCTSPNLPEAFIKGNIAIVAQSGVFGNILLDKLGLLNLYVSKTATLGNRLDVDECEILDYLQDDPSTEIIMLYLEGAADGRQLYKTLAEVTAKKPVLVLKSGRTAQGKLATASHTGSLSGEDHLYEGLFKQTGAIRTENLPELIEHARTFATQPLPKGNRLGIITGSGSMGALATDAAIDAGLEVPLPSEATIKKMKEIAPSWMNVKNPLDVGPSATFQQGLAALLEDETFDMILAIVTIPYSAFKMIIEAGATVENIYGNIKEIRKLAPEKPFLISVIGHDEIENQVNDVSGIGTPVFTSSEMAVKTLAAMWKYKQWLERSV